MKILSERLSLFTSSDLCYCGAIMEGRGDPVAQWHDTGFSKKIRTTTRESYAE
jgi:hypothetical protein